MFAPEQRLTNEGGRAAPKPQQPAAPLGLKKAPKQWERTFVGKAKDVKFQLRIIRDESGRLIGRYMATPGSNAGWHVEGVIREDNSFILKGTDNNAEFEGKFSPDGKKISTSFSNKTASGEFKVESMHMGFVVMPPRVAAPNPVTSVGSQNEATISSGPPQIIDRKNVKAADIAYINNQNYKPKSMAKKDRHSVFFNIIETFRRLGAPYPEIMAAQWALESGWGKSESGKNNLFGIKEFDSKKPRTWVQTHEWDPKLGKLVLVSQPFADYQDVLDGFIARANFTINNPRYAKAGYFEAKTLAEAALALDRAGYANTGQAGQYAGQLTSVLKGCGIDPEKPITGGPAAPQTPSTQQAVTTQQATGPSTAAGLDELDRLIGLQAPAKTYTPKQIDLAREKISETTNAKTKGDLYEILQTKIPYHNQRNNTSIGLQSDRWTYRDINGRDRWIIYTGRPIGDIMCNLTSLAMVLETLGIENPRDDQQYEDFLEAVRREEDLAPRTVRNGWAGVAAELEAKQVKHFETYRGGYKEWSRDVLPYLRAGAGVMMSLNGHIVRLQSVNPKGIVVDDPYGKLPSLLNYSPGNVTGSYNKNLNSPATEKGVGEDNFFPWQQVQRFTFLWIAAFQRK